nr:hypothetical protein [uncultured Tolumonas sp.]
MKSTHYDWKIIIVIALFLALVTVLVALKLVYPNFEPGKLLAGGAPLSSASAESVKNIKPTMATKPVVMAANPVTPQPQIKPIAPVATQPPIERPASVVSTKIPPLSSAHNTDETSAIVCSAEDREAQLCQ